MTCTITVAAWRFIKCLAIMPTLTELTLYPIKSCAGISLQRAAVTPFGLMSAGIQDREWMLVDDLGNFLSQREYPAMARIIPSLQAGKLAVNAPGMAPLDIPLALPDPDSASHLNVRVWDDVVQAHDCDAAIAAWFSQAIGVSCRLARFHPQATRLAAAKWTDSKEVATLFADGFPLLLISEASLADLNRRLLAQARAPLPMNRFRPNLVIAGIAAFEEDYAATIRIGTALLRPAKPCARCTIPAVDQATGISGPDPLDILQTYRANSLVDGGIAFGMNAYLLEGDRHLLEVGQEVEVELAF
jgi:uncharacterized protein YcbX